MPRPSTSASNAPQNQLTLESIEQSVGRGVTRAVEGLLATQQISAPRPLSTKARRPVQPCRIVPGLPSRLEDFPERILVGQLAAFWNVSPDHILNLIEDGSIQAINIAKDPNTRKCPRILRDSVIRFEQSRNAI